MTNLPVHRYQFNCRSLGALNLNYYSGSMLRGAFGRSLRKTVCVTRQNDCKSCLLYRQCTYPKVFETPAPLQSNFQQFSQIPNAYIIEPPPMWSKQLAVGDVFSFNIVLIGQAISALPIVIYALETALQAGLGVDHVKTELIDVVFEPDYLSQVIYQADKDRLLLAVPDFKPPVLSATEQINLQLLTPLRIQQHGQVLSKNMQAKDFLLALLRRYYLLQEFHTLDYTPPNFKALAQLAATITIEHNFHWCEWERYSHRQKQKMTFTGVLGELSLQGELTPFLPLLQAGLWLHVGNKTTFGMGRYQVLC